MAKYRISETQAAYVTWIHEIEASSADEAKELWREGKSELVETKIGDNVVTQGSDVEVTEVSEEDADFCGQCHATHWPADEDEVNSTWQQWRCDECGSWNDREAPLKPNT